MKTMAKGRKQDVRTLHEAKKRTSVLTCLQQTAEWLEMYTRILRDLRQAPVAR